MRGGGGGRRRVRIRRRCGSTRRLILLRGRICVVCEATVSECELGVLD